MNAEQVQQAGKICKLLGEEWKELLAGSEGFLTDEKRAGLLGHRVSWGELDSMVSVPTEGKELVLTRCRCRAM